MGDPAPAPPAASPLSAEALRALGWRLDARDWRDIRLAVHGAGLVLAGRAPDRRGGHLALSPADLAILVAEARRQRDGREQYRATRPRPGALGYQEALRLLGQRLDRRGARLVRVIEHADGLIVQRAPAGEPVATALVPWATLAAWHNGAVQQRQRPAASSMRGSATA